jgi:HPt (histidine-containing phosphotransfer) domain-containing protein
LDTGDLVALAGEDRTFVADMLAIFLERVEETLTRWESAIEAGDRQAIAAAAHRLAAPARQLGFADLASALRALEQDAEGDASMASLANRCRRLQPLLHTASLRAAAERDSQPPAKN